MKLYTEDEIEMFTRWLNDHIKIKKEGVWLYLPYGHEDLKEVGHNVGYATAKEMLHYWQHKNQPKF